MHYKAVFKVVGILFAMFSISLLPPLAISFFSSHPSDDTFPAFLISFIAILATGIAVWLPVRKNREQLGPREGFLTVAAFWFSLVTVGTLPFLLSQNLEINFTDAFFESMSGLTTTGATVLTGIDDWPKSILYYRQQLQWLGGMGIIVLAVAVIPMLGIGGMQLYRAEMPGAMKNTKLTPRIKETAKALWYIYLGLTIICALAYKLAGMSLFDAVTHSFSTIAIGGFSTHDASFAYFEQDLVLYVAIVFMILAGINFALHFRVLNKLRVRDYFQNTELRVYLWILLVTAIIVCTVLLLFYDQLGGPSETIRHGIFQVVSIATTSGFTTDDFSKWPLFVPSMLLAASIIGGCTGSTAGGLKVVRVVLLFKQGRREILQLINPDAIIPIRLNADPVHERVINSVWGFFALYVVSFVILALILQATGLDMTTAFSTVTACLNNLGPALGAASEGYSTLSSASKWVLAFTMLLGRLELLTLLILLTPRYWRD